MPRQSRNLGRSGWAHLIVRGINRENLFYDDEDFRHFADTLQRFEKEPGFELAAWCLMSNHVHLLLFSEDGDFALFMKKVAVSYASYYNKKYDRVGHLFQDRFRSEPISDDRQLLTVARYIYRNPQKAGICDAADYEYTMLRSDGVLAGFFDTPQQLHEYLQTDNNDICMEYDSGSADNDVLAMITELTGDSNPQGLQGMERDRRNDVLRELKKRGVSVRTISRITGINRNIVQRA